MNKVIPGLTAALIISLGGCATNDPYTGERKTSQATKAAVIGGIAGAAVGAATSSKSDREKGILTGAAAGAALGGGIGYYMDKQEEKLRKELQGSGVQVVRNGDTIELIMPGSIVFESGQSDIKERFTPALNSVAKVLGEFNKSNILIEGHTDNTGSAQLNQILSENRAGSVKDYLLNQSIAPKRVTTTGKSYFEPAASNDTVSGRQANRRVELILLPPADA